MPKLIVAATGDEFFLLDDSHYYYDGLPGPTYMMQVFRRNSQERGVLLELIRFDLIISGSTISTDESATHIPNIPLRSFWKDCYCL